VRQETEDKEMPKQRNREARRVEKRISALIQAHRMLESALPDDDGLYRVAGVTFDIATRDEKLAEVHAETCDLINQYMLLFPEEFVQYPDGTWSLGKNGSRTKMQ
jgi:hypothetical protein